MTNMHSAHWITRSAVVVALAAALAGCAGSAPAPVDPNAGALPNTPAASPDILAAVANARVAIVTYMVESPGTVVPQLVDLADYGYDNSLTASTLTVFSQALSLEAKYCIEVKKGAVGYVYKAVGNDADVIPGTCTKDTDY